MIVLHVLRGGTTCTLVIVETGNPLLLRKHHPSEQGKCCCEACFSVRPAADPDHTLDESCRFAGGGSMLLEGSSMNSAKTPRPGPAGTR